MDLTNSGSYYNQSIMSLLAGEGSIQAEKNLFQVPGAIFISEMKRAEFVLRLGKRTDDTRGLEAHTTPP